MTVSRFTKLFYIFYFFADFLLIAAVDKLFFMYRGLDLAQIAIMFAIMSTLMIVFEIPSGAIADRWDRKRVLIFGGLLRAVAMVIWLVAGNLPVFILGAAFLVAGYSFESGTLQAYVYDHLKQHQQEDGFEKIWGRGKAYHRIGIAVAIALGGFLSEHSYEWTVILSASGPLIAIAAISLGPKGSTAAEMKNRGYLRILTGGIKQAVSSPSLLRIFLFTAIVLAGQNITEDYLPVLLKDRLGLSNSLIGIWMALGVGLGSFGSLLAYRFKGRSWKVLIGIAALLGIIQIVVYVTSAPAILGILVVFFVASTIVWVLADGMVQRSITTDERATITSVKAFFQQGGATLGVLLFGFVSNRYGIHAGYGLYGAIFLLYVLGSVLFALRKRLSG